MAIHFWWVVGGLAAMVLTRLGLKVVRRRT
jgi:hypothetical protein